MAQSDIKQPVSERTQFILRVALVVVVLICMGVLSYLSIDYEGEHPKGIKDNLFILTESMNVYFREDLSRRNAFMIVSSLMLDILVLTSAARFAVYATTFRMIIALVLFYSVRAIIQALCTLEQPEGYNWGYPGWFSLVVPYGITNDFFYSGHVGVCFIFYLEFNAIGWFWMSLYSLLTMVVQIVLMLALRSHYSIDMISGIAFGHFFWIMAEKYSYLIDWSVFRIPLEKRMAKDRSLSKEEMLEELRQQRIERQFEERREESKQHFISHPGGGFGGYFITCRNCNRPMTNYMVNENHVVHLSCLPNGSRRDFSEESKQEEGN